MSIKELPALGTEYACDVSNALIAQTQPEQALSQILAQLLLRPFPVLFRKIWVDQIFPGRRYPTKWRNYWASQKYFDSHFQRSLTPATILVPRDVWMKTSEELCICPKNGIVCNQFLEVLSKDSLLPKFIMN